MQWHRLALCLHFCGIRIYNQETLWRIYNELLTIQDEHKLRLMKSDKEAQWWMKPLCTKEKEFTQAEAFLDWQNECSIFLSSSTLNTCKVNSEATSAPLSCALGVKWCSTLSGNRCSHWVLRGGGVCKERRNYMGMWICCWRNKINHCNGLITYSEDMVAGFEKRLSQ